MTIHVEGIDPGSHEDLMNRADQGCELCEGLGRFRNKPCPCTADPVVELGKR